MSIYALLAVIMIHSSPIDEIVQGLSPPKNRGTQPLNLKDGKTIIVTQFQFSGNADIPTQQLQRLTNPYLNRILSESDLTEVEERISLLYKSKGYSSVQVIIPFKQQGSILMIAIKEGPKNR